MFDKILIANRGEVAVRVARTCERMGVATVAVFSEADAEGLHVQICDEAVLIGPPRVQDSYLKADAIIAAAKDKGAQAIHPGYGLLSESADFARSVLEAGLVFIGPDPKALELFGDKLASRELARQAGVRAIPGSKHALTDLAAASQAAGELGYPVMLKAAGGGGGIGMQLVEDEAGLEKAMATCSSRAEVAFGDGRVYLERYIETPRHLEVQIIGTGAGDCFALGERECSVQRRHQKLIEESPAPALTGTKRGEFKQATLCDAALRIAREGEYKNAGTAEFLMDARGDLYFMEFNPRLQVEHVVTEMCTGVDIVELQLLIAAGDDIPERTKVAEASGHAIEARVYAEDPARDFLPQPGDIETLRWPTVAPGRLRFETGVAAGTKITSYYDPLVAKVVAYGPTRHEALLILDRVLAETVIEPLTTNIGFLRQLIADDAFRAGQYDVSLVSRVLRGGA